MDHINTLFKQNASENQTNTHYEENIENAVHQGELWYEKYRPTDINDIIISRPKLLAIQDWFVSFDNRTAIKKGLLFTGPPGLGKTSLAHLLLNQFGYQIKEFNASDIRSQSLVNQNMYDLICISNVNKDSKPIAIIMDEVDGMLTGDRGGIEELLSFMQPNKGRKSRKKTKTTNKKIRTNVWGPPIICICNTGNVKQSTLTNLRKCCVEINFTKPSSKDINQIIDRVLEAEKFDISPEAREEIIQFSQGDFRRLLCLMQHLYSRYPDEIIQRDHITNSYHIFCQKEQDLHVKDNIKRLLNKQLDINVVMGIYQRDKSKTPMVMHQNYIKAIEMQKTRPFERIRNATKTIDCLVDSDIIEKTMYNTQGWHLQPIQGLTCCCIPSYYINKAPKLRTIEAAWTEVLGTSSHTRTSMKKIQEILFMMDKSSSYNTSDIQFLAEIVIHLLVNKRENEAIEYLKQYGLLKPKVVDKLSSIVKLNSYSILWKSRSSSEKSKVENLILQRSQQEDQIQELSSKATTIAKSTSANSKPMLKPRLKKMSIAHKSTPTASKPTPKKPTNRITIASKSNPTRKLILVKK